MKLGNISRGTRINRSRLALEKAERLFAEFRARLEEERRLEVVGLELVSRAGFEVTQRSRFSEEEE